MWVEPQKVVRGLCDEYLRHCKVLQIKPSKVTGSTISISRKHGWERIVENRLRIPRTVMLCALWEAVSIPIVTPSQARATLGSVIAELREHPEKFATRLTPSGDEPDGVTVVREMMQLLWKSQWDRHGVDDTSVPLTVSQEEAEDALSLAVTLVRWFDTGAIYRK